MENLNWKTFFSPSQYSSREGMMDKKNGSDRIIHENERMKNQAIKVKQCSKNELTMWKSLK